MNKNNPNQNNFDFMLYLAGLSMLGFLAIDMYLPAFSIMQQQLSTSAIPSVQVLAYFCVVLPLLNLVGSRFPIVSVENLFY